MGVCHSATVELQVVGEIHEVVMRFSHVRGSLVGKTDAWTLTWGWGRPPLSLKARWVTLRDAVKRVIRSTAAPLVVPDCTV